MTTTLLALSLLACSTTERVAVPDLEFQSAGEVIEGQFVIGLDLSEREQETLGVVRLRWNDAIHAGLYEAPAGVGVERIERALQQHTARGGALVEANRPVRGLSTVNDPLHSYQWNFDMLGAEQIWDYATGRGVTVAVVDTGVSTRGKDTPVNLLQGRDFVDGDDAPEDEEGHGTHVAGTIAQATSNGIGVAGLAYDATILPVRVLGPHGGSTYDVADGITWAVDQGAEVINMSLGSSSYSSVLQDAVDYATERGVVVVAATGNDGEAAVNYPGALEGVIGVGAVGVNAVVAPYSNGGTGIDLVAPGGNMEVDADNSGYVDGILQEVDEAGEVYYAFYQGTSMATPHVAASVALLLSAGVAPGEVEDLLIDTAKDLGDPGWSTWSGYGLIDPLKALRSLDGEAVDDGQIAGDEQVVEDEPEAPADTTAPVFSEVGGLRDGTSLTITWTTDEPASSEIEFEGYGRYGDPNEAVTHHELRFTVSESGEFTFQLISVDLEGNEGRSTRYISRP
ncbi:MAG: peptidase S8 [Deltaproteobacteria bacterium]|nr:peptidase S8 [Deltaproteobacteria bacterium]